MTDLPEIPEERTPSPAAQYRKLADDFLAESNATPAVTDKAFYLASLSALRSIAASHLAIAEQLEELTRKVDDQAAILEREVSR